jgi:ABC-type nitrate/sulfonate/bicarbonate transport system ATPase subunit
MLETQNLSFEYPGKHGGGNWLVLANLSLQFMPGEISVVVGPSGCGKSTLLNILARLDAPSRGAVVYPTNPGALHPTIGYVFQTPSLIPWRSIRENALFGTEIAGLQTEAVNRRCSELLSKHGLAGFESSYPSVLSGGMQQRVSIIRGVLSGAKIMLLDEPFSNSDFLMRRELQSELSRLVDQEQLIAVLVTHDVEEAVRIGDKIIVLSPRPARVKGEIVIPISRIERLRGGTAVIRELSDYVNRVEAKFVSVETSLRPNRAA